MGYYFETWTSEMEYKAKSFKYKTTTCWTETFQLGSYISSSHLILSMYDIELCNRNMS